MTNDELRRILSDAKEKLNDPETANSSSRLQIMYWCLQACFSGDKSNMVKLIGTLAQKMARFDSEHPNDKPPKDSEFACNSIRTLIDYAVKKLDAEEMEQTSLLPT